MFGPKVLDLTSQALVTTTYTLQTLKTRHRSCKSTASVSGTEGVSVAEYELTYYLLQISKAFTELGNADPRLETCGHIDVRLRYLSKGMNNVATRVNPMPIQALHHLQSVVNAKDDRFQSYVDAAYMGFFFLLRSGKYLRTSKNKPILIRNITFRNDGFTFQAATAPTADIENVKF
jgi:hypothetical protein